MESRLMFASTDLGQPVSGKEPERRQAYGFGSCFPNGGFLSRGLAVSFLAIPQPDVRDDRLQKSG